MLSNKSLLTVAALALPMTLAMMSPTVADDFSQTVLDACTLEGASEWRARMVPLTEAEEEIMAVERLACHLLVDGQVDALIDRIVADDGIILLDGAGVADGKEAQRAGFKALLDAGWSLSWEPVDATVSESGDMAWAIGQVKVVAPDGTIDHAKYASVWQKIDGAWKNVLEMRNSNGALGPNLF